MSTEDACWLLFMASLVKTFTVWSSINKLINWSFFHSSSRSSSQWVNQSFLNVSELRYFTLKYHSNQAEKSNVLNISISNRHRQAKMFWLSSNTLRETKLRTRLFFAPSNTYVLILFRIILCIQNINKILSTADNLIDNIRNMTSSARNPFYIVHTLFHVNLLINLSIKCGKKSTVS